MEITVPQIVSGSLTIREGFTATLSELISTHNFTPITIFTHPDELSQLITFYDGSLSVDFSYVKESISVFTDILVGPSSESSRVLTEYVQSTFPWSPQPRVNYSIPYTGNIPPTAVTTSDTLIYTFNAAINSADFSVERDAIVTQITDASRYFLGGSNVYYNPSDSFTFPSSIHFNTSVTIVPPPIETVSSRWILPPDPSAAQALQNLSFLNYVVTLQATERTDMDIYVADPVYSVVNQSFSTHGNVYAQIARVLSNTNPIILYDSSSTRYSNTSFFGRETVPAGSYTYSPLNTFTVSSTTFENQEILFREVVLSNIYSTLSLDPSLRYEMTVSDTGASVNLSSDYLIYYNYLLNEIVRKEIIVLYYNYPYFDAFITKLDSPETQWSTVLTSTQFNFSLDYTTVLLMSGDTFLQYPDNIYSNSYSGQEYSVDFSYNITVDATAIGLGIAPPVYVRGTTTYDFWKSIYLCNLFNDPTILEFPTMVFGYSLYGSYIWNGTPVPKQPVVPANTKHYTMTISGDTHTVYYIPFESPITQNYNFWKMFQVATSTDWQLFSTFTSYDTTKFRFIVDGIHRLDNTYHTTANIFMYSELDGAELVAEPIDTRYVISLYAGQGWDFVYIGLTASENFHDTFIEQWNKPVITYPGYTRTSLASNYAFLAGDGLLYNGSNIPPPPSAMVFTPTQTVSLQEVTTSNVFTFTPFGYPEYYLPQWLTLGASMYYGITASFDGFTITDGDSNIITDYTTLSDGATYYVTYNFV